MSISTDPLRCPPQFQLPPRSACLPAPRKSPSSTRRVQHCLASTYRSCPRLSCWSCDAQAPNVRLEDYLNHFDSLIGLTSPAAGVWKRGAYRPATESSKNGWEHDCLVLRLHWREGILYNPQYGALRFLACASSSSSFERSSK